MTRPCYSMRLLRPFVQLARDDPRFPAALTSQLSAVDDDARIPIATAHTLLEDAVARSGDPALGLRAAANLSLQDIGVLGYTIASAASFGDALDVARRNIRLLNDALDFEIVRRGGTAELRFESRVVLPRAAADYALCAAVRTLAQAFASIISPETRICFLHEAPAELEPYRRAFSTQPVEFSAPFLGLALPEAWLAEPLARADPNLHAVLRKSAEYTLASLPRVESVTERVRALLLAELPGGHPNIARVAKRLCMSPRTLGRRLDEEGTTFSDLLDTLRHRLATRYLREPQLPIPEIARRTGFAKAPAFHRAFRRWRGMTPDQYRRSHRDAAPAGA